MRPHVDGQRLRIMRISIFRYDWVLATWLLYTKSCLQDSLRVAPDIRRGRDLLLLLANPKTMAFPHRAVAVWLGCFLLFSPTAFGAPASPALSIVPNVGSSDFTLTPSSLTNGSTLCGLDSPSLSTSPHGEAVDWIKGTWRISNTLFLAMTICSWTPDPATIVDVLEAAATIAGKKPATALLEEKFVQTSKNKYNKLYFEIGPGETEGSYLTWGEVAQVVGVNGLRKYYETTGHWNTIYFDVMHTKEGMLGEGAVRRWWQPGVTQGRGED